MSNKETPQSQIETFDCAFAKDRVNYYPPDALTPYKGNARTHDDAQIEVLKASIKTFDFVNPALIDKDGVLIAGHGQVEAARQLGLELIPVLCIEGLSQDELKACQLADKRRRAGIARSWRLSCSILNR